MTRRAAILEIRRVLGPTVALRSRRGRGRWTHEVVRRSDGATLCAAATLAELVAGSAEMAGRCECGAGDGGRGEGEL